jgi:clan AA aspartic protease
MTAIQEPTMGRFSVEVELANNEDLTRAKDGSIASDRIRRVRIRGVVDSGATRLVIPQSAADHLGLETSSTTKVRYADGRTADRPMVENIRLFYAGRNSIFNAIVEPDRESALVGVIVLDDLDLIIDFTTQRLVPRDPNQIVSEVE